MPRDQFTLTKREQELRTVLIKAAHHVSKTEPQQVFLRFAGGWVRDKLLGKESHDIDVAINCMTGSDFAEKLKLYVNDMPKENGSSFKVGSIAKILSRPEQSKHLETATVKVHDFFVDFVNLRHEEYASETRIPTMRFGTPLEDAMRRDFTINSLFYNLHTEEIEDWTEKGLLDMKTGIIRTPLDAFETFSDDPLRALRAIRFASHLEYAIDAVTAEAICNRQIQTDLLKKISKERIGIEVDKMIRGRNPRLALQHMVELSLYDVIFNEKDAPIAHLDPVTALDMAVLFSNLKEKPFSLTHDNLRIVWILIFLHPWHNIFIDANQRKVAVADSILRKRLKFSSNDAQQVSLCLSVLPEFRTQVSMYPSENISRSTIALLLRKGGKFWPAVLTYAMLVEITEMPDQNEEVLRRYVSFGQTITAAGLNDIHILKPIINGTEVCTALNLSPGPQVKLYLEKVMEWQLDHNAGTKDECILFLKTLN